MSTSHVLVLPSIGEGLAACPGPGHGLRMSRGDLLDQYRRRRPVRGQRRGLHRPHPRFWCRLRSGCSGWRTIPGSKGQLRAAALQRVRSIGGWSEYGDRWERLLLGTQVARSGWRELPFGNDKKCAKFRHRNLFNGHHRQMNNLQADHRHAQPFRPRSRRTISPFDSTATSQLFSSSAPITTSGGDGYAYTFPASDVCPFNCTVRP